MTSEMDTALAGTAADFLTEFGEAITYVPRSGDSRAIVAVINRDGIAERLPNTGSPQLSITVANDATTGITSAEFDGGGDKVTLRPRINDPAVTRRITKKISEDAAMITLEVN